jgi:cytochrome c553
MATRPTERIIVKSPGFAHENPHPMKPAALLSSLLLGLFAVAAGAAEPAGAAQSASGATPAASGAAPAASEAAPSKAAAAEPVQTTKPDLAQGEAIATKVCVACHAVDGSRGTPAYPILQGQHPEYLVKQLVEFKGGERKNPIMTGIASTLSVQDMKNVAAFYASKVAKPGFARTKELVQLGESVFRAGIADRNVPDCAGCHGPGGSGIPAQYPRLAGQHADYVEAQLVAFRGGTRTNSVPMTGVASKMNDREIKAVSDYIAGLRSGVAAAPGRSD